MFLWKIETKAVRVVKALERGEVEDQKSGRWCNGEWYVVSGWKWEECGQLSSLGVED